MILTKTDKVAVNYNKPDQRNLEKMTVSEAKKYVTKGHFAPGNMLNKVLAAMKFTEAYPGKRAIITSLDKAVESLEGKAGTVITY